MKRYGRYICGILTTVALLSASIRWSQVAWAAEDSGAVDIRQEESGGNSEAADGQQGSSSDNAEAADGQQGENGGIPEDADGQQGDDAGIPEGADPGQKDNSGDADGQQEDNPDDSGSADGQQEDNPDDSGSADGQQEDNPDDSGSVDGQQEGNSRISGDVDEETAEWIRTSGEALAQIAAERDIMALVYLSDEYPVRTAPSYESEAAVTVLSGQTVNILDMAVDENREVWHYVRLDYQGRAIYAMCPGHTWPARMSAFWSGRRFTA